MARTPSDLELYALCLTGYGLSKKAIATAMETDERFIPVLLRGVTKALGARNLHHAMATAFRKGYFGEMDADEMAE